MISHYFVPAFVVILVRWWDWYEMAHQGNQHKFQQIYEKKQHYIQLAKRMLVNRTWTYKIHSVVFIRAAMNAAHTTRRHGFSDCTV